MADKPHHSTDLLRVVGLSKRFPGVLAIDHASIGIRSGEIHALVGENGAGKSTLIKVVTGVHQPDEGSILLEGREITIPAPTTAQRHGIIAIHQEFTLIPALSVADNLFLGRELSRYGLLDRKAEEIRTSDILRRLGMTLDPTTLVSSLSVSEQQLVEIARALLCDARILIMDEPTAALTPREVSRLFEILRDLVGRGIGILFVSHRLNEVMDISDRVTVMRDGVTVSTSKTADVTQGDLVERMVDRALEEEFPAGSGQSGAVRFAVRNLTGGPVHNVSFTVHAGEILGIAGLMGAGRSELARLIFGADRKESGDILLDGRTVDANSPRKAIEAGICLLTEDRKHQGLVLCASAIENFALPSLQRWSKAGLLSVRNENAAFNRHIQSLAIKLSGPRQRAESLSGGNQQKLLVARWLETDSQVVIFDEPTRGIDVGAKYEMYLIIRRLAAAGKVIILISSELPEILGMCDRVLVMKSGRLAGEISDLNKTTQEDVMSLAV